MTVPPAEAGGFLPVYFIKRLQYAIFGPNQFMVAGSTARRCPIRVSRSIYFKACVPPGYKIVEECCDISRSGFGHFIKDRPQFVDEIGKIF